MGSHASIFGDASLATVSVLPVSTLIGVGTSGSTDDSMSPTVVGTVSGIIASDAFSSSGLKHLWHRKGWPTQKKQQ
jgi:hypothetical protein